MAVERKIGDMRGPKSFDEWVDVYERRAGDDVHFELSQGEEIFYNPDKGFFTYVVNFETGRLVVPKMCGDGKFLRRVVFEMVKDLTPYGIEEMYCCSRHRPEVYLRVLGGRFDHVEHTVNLNTGKLEPLYFYVVKVEDSKENKGGDGKDDKVC